MSLTDVMASFLALFIVNEMFYLYPDMSISKLYAIYPVFSEGLEILSGMSIYELPKVIKVIRKAPKKKFEFNEECFLTIILP